MKLTQVFCVLGLAVFAGCNVDRTFPGRSVKGPVVGEPTKIPRGSKAADLAVIEQKEVDLVEEVLHNRQAYHNSLEELRTYYQNRGYPTKEAWAAFELESAKRVKQFRYVLDAEVPSESLRPVKSITEADVLFDEARALMKKGGDGIQIIYREKLMVEAAAKFQQLITEYPDSDKIDDAAFYLGEIHKDYLPDQEALAVAWYERAFTWDPKTPYPARYEAAVVYDFRLNDRDRALELYRQALAEETDLGRIKRSYATHRIEEITRPNRTVQATLP